MHQLVYHPKCLVIMPRHMFQLRREKSPVAFYRFSSGCYYAAHVGWSEKDQSSRCQRSVPSHVLLGHTTPKESLRNGCTEIACHPNPCQLEITPMFRQLEFSTLKTLRLAGLYTCCAMHRLSTRLTLPILPCVRRIVGIDTLIFKTIV